MTKWIEADIKNAIISQVPQGSIQDLFGDIDFENINNTKVFSQFDKIVTLKKSKNINILSIDDIKLDFVNYSYPWLQKYLHFDGIRLAGIEDIAAMKLAAITGRGTRKDFVDIYFICLHVCYLN